MITRAAAVPFLVASVAAPQSPAGTSGVYKQYQQDAGKNAESYHLCFIALIYFHSSSF